MITVADLRTGPDLLHVWQRYGVGDELDAAATCPLCRCNKSGYAAEPNTINAACTDWACPCHAEDPS